jgi:uncharacterized protein (TIGR03435 family)
VASVKIAAPADEDTPSFSLGGPGTAEPERITFERQHLIRVVSIAYGVAFDQISGPSWLGNNLYSIVAKVPAGASAEQVKLMWRDLLAERFHLKAHLIKKDFPVYELTVSKSASRFRKTGDGATAVEPGFPVPAAGQIFALSLATPRTVRLTFRDCSMADFAHRLGFPLSTPGDAGGLTFGRVVDRTGLDGHYDFTLEFSGAWRPGGAYPQPLSDGKTDTAPSLFDALRQQLGFRLEEKKTQLDFLVVDHVEKIPTEN